jgi:hypothetical protein
MELHTAQLIVHTRKDWWSVAVGEVCNGVDVGDRCLRFLLAMKLGASPHFAAAQLRRQIIGDGNSHGIFVHGHVRNMWNLIEDSLKEQMW